MGIRNRLEDQPSSGYLIGFTNDATPWSTQPFCFPFFVEILSFLFVQILSWVNNIIVETT